MSTQSKIGLYSNLELRMHTDRKTLLLPIALITTGTGWLLSTLGVAPDIDWVWTLGLAVTGVLCIVLAGFDKVTFVAGCFFLVSSGLAVLRQTGRLSVDVEIPVLVIVAGVLLMIARLPIIPAPTWVQPLPEDSR